MEQEGQILVSIERKLEILPHKHSPGHKQTLISATNLQQLGGIGTRSGLLDEALLHKVLELGRPTSRLLQIRNTLGCDQEQRLCKGEKQQQHQ
jgi:hypothetical protein